MYVCMYVCMYAYIYMHTHTYIYIYIYITTAIHGTKDSDSHVRIIEYLKRISM